MSKLMLAGADTILVEQTATEKVYITDRSTGTEIVIDRDVWDDLINSANMINKNRQEFQEVIDLLTYELNSYTVHSTETI